MDPLRDPTDDLYEIPLTGPRSIREEIANSATHGAGFLLSVAGSVVLMHDALLRGDRWHILGAAVFCVTMTFTYLASTLSHVYQRPTLKNRFRELDQGVIYLFVAGSYVPWALVYLREGWPLIIMFLICGVALLGFASKVFFSHRVERVSVWLYLILGWLPIISLPAILAAIPHPGLWWMLAGGVCYTVGVAFLLLDERLPYFHAVWHKLVMAGSFCHWYAVWRYVLPH